jgi:hypothetical protein
MQHNDIKPLLENILSVAGANIAPSSQPHFRLETLAGGNFHFHVIIAARHWNRRVFAQRPPLIEINAKDDIGQQPALTLARTLSIARRWLRADM